MPVAGVMRLGVSQQECPICRATPGVSGGRWKGLRSGWTPRSPGGSFVLLEFLETLLDHLFLNERRGRRIFLELHRVAGLARRHRAQFRGVAEHLAQRHPELITVSSPLTSEP